MKKLDWAVALALALCAVALAACGSGGDSATAADAAEREEAALEFAECMREHGVDMPDPQVGQDGGGVAFGFQKGKGGTTSGANPNAPATKKALSACEGKLGPMGEPPSAEEQEKFKEQALAFAECMRENGVDMPDPQFGAEGKVTQRIGGPGSSGPKPNSPAFQQAQEACQSKAPGGGKAMMFGGPPQ
jgi:hypothetical protein